MTTTSLPIEKVKLHNVRQARKRRDRAEGDLRAAIHEARAAGATLQSIADAANVTRQRIHAMLKGGR